MTKFFSQLIGNSRGNTLIQVVIAAGIMGILSVGLMSIISNQNKEVAALTERLLTSEIQTQIKNQFLSPDFCNCVFRGKSFNTNPGYLGIVPSDQLDRLRTGYSTTPLDPIPCQPLSTDLIPPTGNKIEGSNMTVASIGVENMQVVSPSTYAADIAVEFDNTVRTHKKIRTTVMFTVNTTSGSPSARPFANCGPAAVTTTPTLIWGVGPVAGQTLSGVVLTCPPGRKITGWIPKPASVYPGHGCYGGFAISYRQGCDILSDSSARCYNVYTPGQWDNWCWGSNWDEGGWLVCM